MNVFGFVLSEPTLWFAFAVCLLCIDLFIGTSMLLFMTLSAFIMMSVSMVFDDLNFATSAVVFSALCFITYFIVKAVVKSKRQDDINYANEDMMSFRFKLDQDVSAGVKTRIAINHIHYTVLARSNYNRTCQVMVYDVVDGVLLITSNIPSHEFAVKKPSGEILKTLNSTLATTFAITHATTHLHLKTIHHQPFLIQLHQAIAVVPVL